MTRQRALKLSVGALLLFSALSPLLHAKEDPSAVETKIALEESLERRIKSVIGQILGSDDVIVIVTADMYTAEERKSVQPVPRAKEAESAVLPGVPAPDKMDGRETAPMLTFAETRTLLKKLTASVVLDKSVADADVKVVEKVASNLLGLQPERGDSLDIQRMSFHRGDARPFNWRRLMQPPDLFWVMGAFFIVFMTVFFYSSFRVFLREFVKALRSHADAAQEQIKMMQMQKNREPELAGREEADLKNAELDALLTKKAAPVNGNGAAHENGKNGVPFSFVNESNIRNLKYLLKKESPLQIAIVLNYLTPALANDLLSSLDAAVQQDVLTQLSNVSEQNGDLVRALEEKVKEHIGFIVGGEDRLRVLLDSADPLTQQTLLSALSKKDAPLAGRLRKQIFTIDDLATLEGPVLAAIIRRINARTLAGVLRSTPPNVQEKVLASLAPGIAAILKEEINLAKPLPPQKLAQEQRRLLDAIRRLSDEGVIPQRKGAA